MALNRSSLSLRGLHGVGPCTTWWENCNISNIKITVDGATHDGLSLPIRFTVIFSHQRQ